jgi:hypothetical protein
MGFQLIFAVYSSAEPEKTASGGPSRAARRSIIIAQITRRWINPFGRSARTRSVPRVSEFVLTGYTELVSG